jgi:hypothetical protein
MIKIKINNRKIFLILIVIFSWSVYLLSSNNFYATINYKNALPGACPSDLLKLAQGISEYATSNDSRINLKIDKLDGICSYRVMAKSSASITEVVNILDKLINKSIDEKNAKYEFCKILQNSINPSNKLLVDVFQKSYDKSYLTEFENISIMISYYMNNCNFGKSFTRYNYLIHSDYTVESSTIGIKDILIPISSSIGIILLLIFLL